MQEDSMAMSEDENSDSEVVLLGQSSHLSNLLLGNQRVQDQISSKREQKLDEKLRDLGLYEEYMSIEQKEELLAVVDVSRRTAELEENQRQQCHSFLDGPHEFGEEIEFNMQESVWVANDASFLHPSPTMSDTASPSFPEDMASVSSTVRETHVSLDDNSMTEKINDLANSEEEMDATSQELFEIDSNHVRNIYEQEFPEPIQRYRRRTPRRSRGRRARSGCIQPGMRGVYSQSTRGAKVISAQPIVQNSECKDSQMLIDMQQIGIYQQKLFLEKSMSTWKPCMSPVAQPLVATRILQQDATNVPFICFEKECGQNYLTSFENYNTALCSLQLSSPKCLPWGKPVTILRHSYSTRRSGKLEDTSEIVGYQEENSDNEFLCELAADSEQMPSSELISRTAKSAFQPIKPNEVFYDQSQLTRLDFLHEDRLSQTESPFKTTRSGASYGSRKLPNSAVIEEKVCGSSQQIALFSQIECKISESASTESNSTSSTFVDHVRLNCASATQNDVEDRLPRFDNLRPTTCRGENLVLECNSLAVRKDGLRTYSVKSQKSNENSQVGSPNLEVQDVLNNSEQRSESPHSTSSTVGEDSPINVEAVVDDEIAQFILKRKRLQENNLHEQPKHYSPVKRLKKSTS